MLCALIFRGVAIEFYFKADNSRVVWNILFCFGSTLAAFCQGIILGTFIDAGYHQHNHLTGIGLAWFSTFSIFCGIAIILGYSLLGATWLILKTEEQLQKKMYKIALPCLIGVSICAGLVSIWTPLLNPFIMQRWFSVPNFYYLLPIPMITCALIVYTAYALHIKSTLSPFISSLGIFLCCYLGIGISLWPYIIPYNTTIWEASSPPKSLSFILVGVIILLPTLLAYTAYAYYIFRGKIDSTIGYN